MRHIYRKALRKWGFPSQADKLTEECAELIQAVNKYRRGKGSSEKLIEECVDVELMIAEVKEYFSGPGATEYWGKIRNEKLARLAALLEGDNVKWG